MQNLSFSTETCWAKKSFQNGVMQWLPLVIHMQDSAAVAKKLWDQWMTQGVKNTIAKDFSDEEYARKLIIFLSAIHDLGKATPVFQSKLTLPLCKTLDDLLEEKLIKAGLAIKPFRTFSNASKTPHALATQTLLHIAGCKKNIAAIAGAHHGKPSSFGDASQAQYEAYSQNYHLGKEGKAAWKIVQDELIEYALVLSGFSSLSEMPDPHMSAQVLLSGMLVVVDWIASNEAYFPYISVENSNRSIDRSERINDAWDELSFAQPWIADNAWMNSDLYQERFGFIANILQRTVAENAETIDEPGIFVIEAPMGVGKTEAALVCAEIFAEKTKRQGVFFALPTQATSDGIFPRLIKWINHLDQETEHTIKLAHGKAQFNKDYMSLKVLEGSDNVAINEEFAGAYVHEWFEGQKKSLLADFVVGTIDQLLMAALKQKHVMMRHLGLAGKVVIIDECHAYDAYMGQYLNRALNWLGVYNVPVIVLSATLPSEKRQSVIDAYLNRDYKPKLMKDPLSATSNKSQELLDWVKCRNYPLLTYTDKTEIKQIAVRKDENNKVVTINFLPEEAIISKLNDLLINGGCAGVLLNTVKKAQQMAAVLRDVFGEEVVHLLHSRFLAPDRAEKEAILMQELGKPDDMNTRPSIRIVVGTQVLEQSLDIDFDVMITELCPMDLLLQRLGRLHRHIRTRPEMLKQAMCYVINHDTVIYDIASENIYGAYLLMRTEAFLPQQVHLPKDIPNLVQDVYDDNIEIPREIEEYDEAKKKWKLLLHDKEERAKVFRLDPAWSGSRQSISGWLDSDASNQRSEAAVRDTDESIEVILVQESKSGSIHFLPWSEQGQEIPINEPLSNEIAVALARQRIRLPSILCAPWNIDKTIEELENSNAMLLEWQRSPWLKGDLVLILDENFSAKLGGYHIIYSQKEGLAFEKEESKDV